MSFSTRQTDVVRPDGQTKQIRKGVDEIGLDDDDEKHSQLRIYRNQTCVYDVNDLR